MGPEQLLMALAIGLAAGWIGSRIVSKGGGYSLLGDLIIGVIGAFIGSWLFARLGIRAGGLLGSLATATVGAIMLLAVLRLIKRA